MINIPTYNELYTGIRDDLNTKLGINIPLFGKVFLDAIAAVEAAKLKVMYLVLSRVLKNVWPDTADIDMLTRFGKVKLGREPFAATQGKYELQVTGQIGAVIPQGALYKSDDTAINAGFLFQVDTEKTLVATTDTVEVRALTAGPEARMSLTETMTATSPLLNIEDQAIVVSEVDVPLEAEDIEDYRALIIQAFQLESQGGAATDYRIWASDAQGARAVYPYTKSGVCSATDVYVESNTGDGTADPTLLDDVEAVLNFDPDDTRPINERGRRPINTQLFMFSVTPLDVDITYVNPIDFDTDTETAITNAITEELFNIRPFVAAADIEANRNDSLSRNTLISLTTDILTGNQKFDDILLVVDGNNIPVEYVFEDGDIPRLNSITF